MKRYMFLLIPVAGFFAWFYYHQWQHWLAYATGSYNCPNAGCPGGSPHNYGFFSGSGSDIGEITIVISVITAFLVIWRSHTCHGYWWCWRRPLHQLEGTPYKLCHIHHPDDVPSVKEAIAAHGGPDGT